MCFVFVALRTIDERLSVCTPFLSSSAWQTGKKRVVSRRLRRRPCLFSFRCSSKLPLRTALSSEREYFHVLCLFLAFSGDVLGVFGAAFTVSVYSFAYACMPLCRRDLSFCSMFRRLFLHTTSKCILTSLLRTSKSNSYCTSNNNNNLYSYLIGFPLIICFSIHSRIIFTEVLSRGTNPSFANAVPLLSSNQI